MRNYFLQSQVWEEFQQRVGHKTLRVSGLLLIKKKLLMGWSYFYCPRAYWPHESAFWPKLKEVANKEKAVFLRIEPLGALMDLPKLYKTADVQPSRTLMLDLTLDEQKILEGMHPKTRYNIRLAEKKGVSVFKTDAVNQFCVLMADTVKRDGFRAHQDFYYKKMLTAPSALSDQSAEKFEISLYAAKYQGQMLAAGIFVFYNDTVVYLHGASTHARKNVMAPYALHWHMIKLAKHMGFKYYDFYGIDEVKWPGVTRFKKGFGGVEVKYPGAYDIVFRPFWYLLYKTLKKFKQLIKN